MADKLEFSLGLGVDMTGFEKEWKEKEKEIQKLIDDSAFKIKLEGVEGLDKIRDQLKEIQKLQKDFSKPLTGAQALREQLKHEERARLANAKAMEFEAGSADRLRRQKTQAELTELRLAKAKEKSVKTTNAQTQAYRTQTGVLNGLKQFTNSYLSLLGGYRLMSNIKQITSEFELQRVSLRAITQDAAFADALFAKIKTTATESPFSTKDLVTYTKQLAAYRIENEQLYGTMNMLADVSAGLGVSMDRLILAYGQVKAASVLRGTELRQFTEAGIPLVDELAKKFSQLRGEVVSTGEVFDLISTRQVPFEMVADIFKEMTAEGGRFYEMQKKQSESLYGVFENLKDNIQNAYDEIGQSNRGLLMGFGKMATGVAKHLNLLVSAVAPLIVGMGAYRAATVLATKGTLGLATSSSLLAKAEASLNRNRTIGNAQLKLQQQLMIRASAANNRYAIATIKAATATNVFTRSWYALKAAIIANPLGAVLVGLTAVVSALSAYGDKLRSVEDAQKKATEAGELLRKQVEKDFNLEGYNKIVDNLKEQEVLLKSSGKSYEEFQKIFPKLANKYKNQEGYEKALAQAQTQHQRSIAQLKTEYTDYFGYLDVESSKVANLTQGYEAMSDAMRKARLSELEGYRDEAQATFDKLKSRSESTFNKFLAGEGWFKMLNFVGASLNWLGVPMNAAKEQLGPAEAAVANYESQIESLLKVMNDAEAVMVRWRKNYKDLVDATISDDELAKLSFTDAAKKANEELDKLREKRARLNAVPVSERDSSIEADIASVNSAIPKIERWLEMYQQFKATETDTTPLDNLKSELSLVEKIYKRYGELRRLMSDEAAKADIKEIYGNLTDVDFLDPVKLKARLQKMLKAAQDMGDSGKQLAIELGLKIQDIDLNEAKDKLEAALNSLSQQIKQQQDASEFFEKMLGFTGDVELSTNLTLGVTGVDVEGGNVGQLLSQQLAEILYSEPVRTQVATEFDLTGDWNADKLEEAIRKGEVSVEMLQNLADKLPQDVQPKFREALASFVDFNKQQVESLFKTIDKYGDSEVKLKLLAQQFESKKLNFSKMINPNPDEISDEDWAEYIRKGIEAAEKAYNEEVGKVKLESFQKQFAEELSNLDAITTEKAQTMMDSLNAILKDVKLDPTQMKTLNDYKEKLHQVFFNKEPTEEAIKAWNKLWEAIIGNDSDAAATALNNLSKSLESMIKKAKEVETIMNTLIDSALNIADAFGVAFSDDAQDAINQFKNGIGTVVSGLSAAKSAVDLFSGTDKTMKNLTLTGLALGAAFAAISWISGAKVRKANKEIERQEKLLKNLERAYRRLEEIQEDLVGTDWVRNQQRQIANLQKQISAFEAQRRAEQSKGKKTDEDAIEDYTDKILDAQEQMRELRKEIVSEMAGTSLPDATKDFAQSWIDAYLSFDNTMGALKASFKDMMQNMVQNSMMAKLVQKRLEPVFDAIDKAYEDAELTPAEWQSIMDMGNKAIEYIDEDLTHLAEMLDLRNQLGTQETSNLTGIAKGVAQASEETVLTLAGYANSILYYQIWLKNDVAAIRAILEGRMAAVSPAPTGDGGFNVGQLVSLQQQSLSQLQAINLNTGNTVSQLQTLNDKIDSIISTAGTSSRKVVNTRLSN